MCCGTSYTNINVLFSDTHTKIQRYQNTKHKNIKYEKHQTSLTKLKCKNTNFAPAQIYGTEFISESLPPPPLTHPSTLSWIDQRHPNYTNPPPPPPGSVWVDWGVYIYFWTTYFCLCLLGICLFLYFCVWEQCVAYV